MEKKLYQPWPATDHKIYKYWVYVKSNNDGIKKIGFGNKRYQHYYDRIGYYSNLDHYDKERRKRYIDRHKKNENWKDKNSAGYYSKNYLW